MSRSQAIALLLMAACVVLAAAKPTLRPMYDEWLEQQGEAKIAAVEDDSEYYDYPRLEHETVCLKATAFENAAQCTATKCNTIQFDTKVACCNGIQTNGNYNYPDDEEENDVNPAPAMVIGSCSTTVEPYVFPVVIAPGHEKLATFTTYCNIPHGSLCGAPFCNDLQLVQNGVVMQGMAVAKNDPRLSPPAGWSFNILPVLSRAVFNDQDIIGNRSATVQTMAAAETEGYGYGDYYGGSNTPPPPPATTKWFKGFVEVYSGPVTIFSKKHAFKYHFGHMEFTMWAGNTTEVSSKSKLPEVNPWTFTLKMNKPLGY